MLTRNQEYFWAIVEEKSISKAAERMFVSQPSISKYLSNLEDEIGTTLFDRSSHPLCLTQAGGKYAEYLNTANSLTRDLIRNISVLKKNISGKVTFGIGPWRSSVMLPLFLPQFTRQYPYIDVQIVDEKTDSFKAMLCKDQIDFCIMMQPDGESFTKREKIMDERFVLAVHRDNPLFASNSYNESIGSPNISTNTTVSIYEILDQVIILLYEGHYLSTVVANTILKHNVRFCKSFYVNNLSTAMNLVNTNMGITFVPELGMICNKYEDIRYLILDDPLLSGTLSIVYNKHHQLTPQCRLLIDFIKQVFTQLAPRKNCG